MKSAAHKERTGKQAEWKACSRGTKKGSRHVSDKLTRNEACINNLERRFLLYFIVLLSFRPSPLGFVLF
jgi:hypothetical protein